jgi:RNA polymerase sigma factor (sigma-70 family)
LLSWLQNNINCLLIYVSLMQVVKKYTDSDLLEAIKSLQKADLDGAIKYMYRAYYELLSVYTCNNSGNEEDAQDVFQEVLVAFIDLVQKNKFRGESSIKTFLYTMNRNIWLNELKKRGKAEKRNMIFENEKDSNLLDVSHLIVQNETRKQILSIVDELGEICKKILLAVYYENLSMKEILLNVEYETEQALRNKKSKCLKQLEQLLTANPMMAKTLKAALQYE